MHYSFKHTELFFVVIALGCWLLVWPAMASSYSNLIETAADHFGSGRYDESAEFYLKALSAYEGADTTDISSVAESFDKIAGKFIEHKKHEHAIGIWSKVLSLRENRLGADDASVVLSLNNLSGLYQSQGRFAEAEPLLQRALEIREQSFGPEHPQTALALNNLANLYYAQGRYAESEPLLQRSFAIYEQSRGGDDPVPAFVLNNLARLYYAQGRYAEAEPLFLRALVSVEQARGPEHSHTAMSLNNLANLYRVQGRYADAEQHLQRALEIREKSLGLEHPDTGASLGSLANLYYVQGRYADAEPLYRRSLAIHQQAEGPEHPHTALALNNLANLYFAQGRYAEAEPLLLRSLAIRQLVSGPEHPDTAMSLNNLALLYCAQCRYGEAEPLYQRALASDEQLLGPEHPRTATSLNNLANLYRSQGRYAEAEPLYQRSLAIRQQAVGPKHPDTALAFNNLAWLYIGQGRFAEAEPVCQRALSVFEQAVGPEHPSTATSLNNLAILRCLSGNGEGALSSACSAGATSLRILRREFPTMSARERDLFLSSHDHLYLDVLLSLALGTDSEVRKEAARASAIWVLRTKGLILSTLLEDRELLHSVPEAGPLTDRLRATKAQLSALSLQQATGESAEQRAAREARIRELTAQSEEQQRELAMFAARQREGHPEPEEIGIKDVHEALNTGQVLVEFFRFRPLSDAEQHKERGLLYLPDEYAAIIIRQGVEDPVVLSLGDAESLDEIVHQMQVVMRTGEPAVELLKKLHYQIWAPLAEHIGDAGRIYISPDSELSFVPFAALLRPDGTYLCEHHEIGYVASGRDLLIRTRQGDAGAPALFGDPAFGELQGAGDYLDRGVAFRSLLGTEDRAVLAGIRFPPLPGTKLEVQALQGVLKASKQDPVAYLGLDATESRLKALQRPGLLHLATHGFFLPDIEQESTSRSGLLPSLAGSDPMSVPIRIENPMLRSGLALTGAALASAGREGTNASDTEDGIVTAEEISSLDLSSTRMVVLSACDTGVGEARAGQGVMGLRRAFAHAGAQNLVMTLWQVQDEATVNLMVSFYDRYLETGDAVGALSHLQRKSITQAREAGEASNPHVWGPFLVSVQGKSR